MILCCDHLRISFAFQPSHFIMVYFCSYTGILSKYNNKKTRFLWQGICSEFSWLATFFAEPILRPKFNVRVFPREHVRCKFIGTVTSRVFRRKFGSELDDVWFLLGYSPASVI
jgi:hypothetical protein